MSVPVAGDLVAVRGHLLEQVRMRASGQPEDEEGRAGTEGPKQVQQGVRLALQRRARLLPVGRADAPACRTNSAILPEPQPTSRTAGAG